MAPPSSSVVGQRWERAAKTASSGEDALSLAFQDHVALHDLAHDPRDEAVAARIGNEPAPPFQLVERGIERSALEPGGTADPPGRHAIAEHGSRLERGGGGWAQRVESHADRAHDGFGEIAGPGVFERLERPRPHATLGVDVQSLRDRVTDLDRKQGDTCRVRRDPAAQTTDLVLRVVGEGPAYERHSRILVERW